MTNTCLIIFHADILMLLALQYFSVTGCRKPCLKIINELVACIKIYIYCAHKMQLLE